MKQNLGDNNSLPPFKKSELTLISSVGKSSEGGIEAIVAGGKIAAKKSSNTIVLELYPYAFQPEASKHSQGSEMANYVLAVATAVENQDKLALKSLTIETQFEVEKT